MSEFSAQIDYYLKKYRHGADEDAFHGLREINQAAIPELMNVFRSEQDVGARQLLVEIIWQYRDQSVIPFLGEALMNDHPRIWREALDGLVALKSPASVDCLRSARARQFSTQRETDEFHRWLDEAIQQAETNAHTK